MAEASPLKHDFLKPATFPRQLRDAKRWLLWKREPRIEGEPVTKIPYWANPDGVHIRREGTMDGVLDTARLVDYSAAVAVFKADPKFFTGLGFALGKGWWGVDYDHVRNAATGGLPDWVDRELQEGMPGGMYAEVSPSEEGLHVIGRWPEPWFKNAERKKPEEQGGHVEAWYENHFLTMTGNIIHTLGVRPDGLPPPVLGVRPDALSPITARPALRLVPADGHQTAQIDAGAAQPGKVTSTWLADRQTILECLADLDPDCPRKPWLDAGMAIHYAMKGHPEGLVLWEEWSAKAAPKPCYVPGHCAYAWSRFKPDVKKPITLATLIEMAKEARALRAPAPAPEVVTVKTTRMLPGNLPERFSRSELKRMKIPATRWLVDKLIAPGLTLLAAPPKAGKSYLALQMALCVAAGKPFLDRETNASKVVYFDLEQWHALMLERDDRISAAHAIPDEVPLDYGLTMPTGEGAITAMTEEINRGALLIVVDIFARIRDELNEDAKKNAYARDYAVIAQIADFALRYPEVAIIVIHHANKGKHDEWQAKISGSYGLTGASHANLYLSRPDLRGMDEDDKDHAKNYRVLHAQGKLVQEQELVIEMMAGGGGWQCARVKPWEISATLLQTKVLLLLEPRYPAYTTGKVIAELLGRTHTSVHKLLVRMGHAGKIESEGQGGAGYRVRRIS